MDGENVFQTHFLSIFIHHCYSFSMSIYFEIFVVTYFGLNIIGDFCGQGMQDNFLYLWSNFRFRIKSNTSSQFFHFSSNPVLLNLFAISPAKLSHLGKLHGGKLSQVLFACLFPTKLHLGKLSGGTGDKSCRVSKFSGVPAQ